MNFSNNVTHKLAIGTAQFGMDYGVANKNGQISERQMQNILSLAQDYGIKSIDTAKDYGDCEFKLGKFKLENFDVSTKITNLSFCKNDVKDFLIKEVKNSLQSLNIKKLDTLLLHSSKDLLSLRKNEIYDSLSLCKSLNYCRKIGISSYASQEVFEILDNYEIDVVQFPLSVFNRDLLFSGLLSNLKNKGIEVHVRSIFLQGLLLMDRDDLDNYFNPWLKLLDDWDAWIAENKTTHLDACLEFVFKIKDVDKVIVGVDSFSHFEQIINSIKNIKNSKKFPIVLSSVDEDLINPSKWNLSRV